MKATLEFNLDNLDERKEHLRAVMATNMVLCLWEMLRIIPAEVDHRLEATELELSPFEVKEIIFEEFIEVLEKHNINIDELID